MYFTRFSRGSSACIHVYTINSKPISKFVQAANIQNHDCTRTCICHEAQTSCDISAYIPLSSCLLYALWVSVQNFRSGVKLHSITKFSNKNQWLTSKWQLRIPGFPFNYIPIHTNTKLVNTTNCTEILKEKFVRNSSKTILMQATRIWSSYNTNLYSIKTSY